jgi:hypothetical protein
VFLSYTFADPIVVKIVIGEQEYDTLSIPDCELYGAPGEPVLPLKSAYILIPYGEEVYDIQVIPGSEVHVGELYIQPGQEQVPLCFSGPVEPTPPKEDIYNSSEIYPKQEEYRISRA